jgi:hypothetical protein
MLLRSSLESLFIPLATYPYANLHQHERELLAQALRNLACRIEHEKATQSIA